VNIYEEKGEKLFPVFVTGTIERRIFRIYVRKSQEKSFRKKPIELKTLIKKSQFLAVPGHHVTGNDKKKLWENEVNS